MFRRLTAAAVSVLLLLCLAAAPATAAPPEEYDADRVDTFVEEYLARNGLPGASVAVVKDGELVQEAGYGTDSVGAPLTEHSRMRIESVSKSFTAFAVLQLVQEQKVDLDRPVQEYLPEFRPDDSRAAAVTVRQLLSHTSGLPSPTLVAPAETLEQGVARIGEWRLSSDPGTTYFYSNANYWTAARLVERVGGEDFSARLGSHLFAPLGMTDTLNVTTTTEPVDGLPRGYVTAYGGAVPARELAAMSSGAGGVISTSHDMARWLAMQQRKGTAADGTQLLSAPLVEESHALQPNAGRSGLGWVRSGPTVTPERIQHSGAGTAYQAQQSLMPSSGYGVVVLLNSYTPTREHAYEIADGIVDIIDGAAPEVGLPVPTIIDLVLGALTLGVVLLGVRGVLGARRWVARRRPWGAVRFGLRLLPQLIMPALAVVVFGVLPTVNDNSSTPADAVALFPAAMVLLLVSALVGVVLVGTRIVGRVTDHRRDRTPRRRRPVRT